MNKTPQQLSFAELRAIFQRFANPIHAYAAQQELLERGAITRFEATLRNPLDFFTSAELRRMGADMSDESDALQRFAALHEEASRQRASCCLHYSQQTTPLYRVLFNQLGIAA